MAVSDVRRCPKCGVTKDCDDFPKDRSRPSGRYTYCRACSAKRTAARAQNVTDIPETLTAAQLATWIDTRAAYSETSDSWHWAYTGPRKASHGRRAQLVVAEAIGSPLPAGARFWCEGEYPGCVNPDHAERMGGMAHLSVSDLVAHGLVGIDHDGDVLPNGFSIASAKSLQDMPHDPRDAEADAFLASHGYNRRGEPLRPYQSRSTAA